MVSFAVLAFIGLSFALLVMRTKGRGKLVVAWVFFAAFVGAWIYAAEYPGSRANILAWALYLIAIIQLVQIAGSALIVPRVPRLLIVLDLLAAASYLSVAVSVLLRFGVNVTGVVATSALLTAVIGLSLQDLTLNLVAGLFVQVEGNLRNGLWIQTEHEAGQIQELRARYTKIETEEGDFVYVPNSSLMKSSVRVVSRKHRQQVSFPLDYEPSPATVIRVVQEALWSAPLTDVAEQPKPRCFVESHHTTHIQYGIHIWLVRPGHSTMAVSDVLMRVYFALRRSGIPATALSQHVQLSAFEKTASRNGANSDKYTRLLEQMDIFRAMNPEDLAHLASVLKPLRYGPGENILQQGDNGNSMFIVTAGSVRVVLESEKKLAETLAVLRAGDFFGEMSLLTGAKRSASVFAAEETECLQIDKSGFALVLERRPELIADISTVLAVRQASLSAVQESMTSQLRGGSTRLDLMSRIERFFGFADKEV